MAIVRDLSGVTFSDGRDKDRPLSTVNRNVSANPTATTLPQYTGEIVQDTTSGQLWQAGNLTNTGWIAITKVV